MAKLKTLSQTFHSPFNGSGQKLRRVLIPVDYEAFWFRNKATHLKCKRRVGSANDSLMSSVYMM